MKRLFTLNFNQEFVFNETIYSLYSGPIRISQTNIVCLCVEESTGLLVELNSNTEVETINE